MFVTSTEGFPSNTVILNIYDLMPNKYTNIISKLGIGLHHTSIEVYGVEYMFGCGAGVVVQQETKVAGGAEYRQSQILGETTFSRYEIDLLAVKFMNDRGYKGNDYHLLLKNCNHFAEEFGKKLLEGGNLVFNDEETNQEKHQLNDYTSVESTVAPAWVNRLARMGSYFICCMPQSFVKPQSISPSDEEVEEMISYEMEDSNTKNISLDAIDELLPIDDTVISDDDILLEELPKKQYVDLNKEVTFLAQHLSKK
mmetsp:Transcript_10743/g.15716  ORF Transcript_10743/g.15716 Transcript_10743/m.15716 type:complete len:254 (+) Transcript_10743:73-834(+)